MKQLDIDYGKILGETGHFAKKTVSKGVETLKNHPRKSAVLAALLGVAIAVNSITEPPKDELFFAEIEQKLGSYPMKA